MNQPRPSNKSDVFNSKTCDACLIDDEASIVFARYGRFAHGLSERDGCLHRLVRGVWGTNDFKQFHYRHWIEEVQTDESVIYKRRINMWKTI